MILILNWIVLTPDNPKNITLRVGIRKDGEHAGYNIHFDELCLFLSCHLYDIKAYRFTSFVFCIELSKEPVTSQERKLLSVCKHENDANDMVEWERNYSLHKNNLKHRKHYWDCLGEPKKVQFWKHILSESHVNVFRHWKRKHLLGSQHLFRYLQLTLRRKIQIILKIQKQLQI